MEVLLIALLSAGGYLIAYHTYGRWLGRKIFRLSASAICPSEKLRDDQDYVPTPKFVVFGHHFTSIAGTGPIVGPAIAIMWGWLPALLWVFFGSIFIGGVHDFGALVVSLRNNGQTVGDIAGKVINRRVNLIFLIVLFLALTIVLAIFGLVIASVFRQYPSSIFPCLVQIPLAIAIGCWLHRKSSSIGNLTTASAAALIIMYLTVIFGNAGPLAWLNESLAAWPLWKWFFFLLVYSYVASILPVWTLLQPRDFINSLQLVSAIGLVIIGLIVASMVGGSPLVTDPTTRPGLSLAAPMIQLQPDGAPMLIPFLFITIACGAISGFHCLVSSGTSSKQIRSETDARFVGYGAMITEGFFAILVLLACGAGIGLGVQNKSGELLTGQAAWLNHYDSWGAAGGLASKIGGFVEGSSNFLKAIGISASAATALMGVLVASFAGTTLDTACRLQRYVIQELAKTLSFKDQPNPNNSKPYCPFTLLQNKHIATLFAISIAMLLAAVPPVGQEWSLAKTGKGGLLLWPLFGATNQLLGGLSFIVITFYLWRRNIPVWFLTIPAIFMLIMPFWALWSQIFSGDPSSWWAQKNWTLIGVGMVTLILEVWIIVESLLLFPKVRGILEPTASEINQINVNTVSN